MDIFKVTLWLIIAVLFAIFSFYSFINSNKYKNLKEEISKPRRQLTLQGDSVFGEDYSDVLNSLYNMIKSLSYIGILGLLLSTFAAIISAFI